MVVIYNIYFSMLQFLKKSLIPNGNIAMNIHHVYGFFYVITVSWFFCECLKQTTLIQNTNYVSFNASETIYNLITCFVYSFAVYCFLYKPHFLTENPNQQHTHMLPQPIILDSIFGVEIASPAYISLVLLSSFCFSMLGEWSFLQFSLTDTDTMYKKFDIYSLGVYVPTCIFMILFIISKLKHVYINDGMSRFLFPIVSSFLLYACMYIQCIYSDKIKCGFHLHHSFLAGFLCLFSAEVYPSIQVASKYLELTNIFVQCVTLGIFIQGINFYGPQDLRIISVKGDQIISFNVCVVVLCVLVVTPSLFLCGKKIKQCFV